MPYSFYVLFNKIICGIKNKPENIILLSLSVVFYFFNNCYLKTHTTGFYNTFFICYFNDLICPLFFLPYTNLLLFVIEKEISRFYQILLVCIFCGVIWEYFAPILKPSSTTDMFDILCYVSGGIIYLFIQKAVSKCRSKNQKD